MVLSLIDTTTTTTTTTAVAYPGGEFYYELAKRAVQCNQYHMYLYLTTESQLIPSFQLNPHNPHNQVDRRWQVSSGLLQACQQSTHLPMIMAVVNMVKTLLLPSAATLEVGKEAMEGVGKGAGKGEGVGVEKEKGAEGVKEEQGEEEVDKGQGAAEEQGARRQVVVASLLALFHLKCRQGSASVALSCLHVWWRLPDVEKKKQGRWEAYSAEYLSGSITQPAKVSTAKERRKDPCYRTLLHWCAYHDMPAVTALLLRCDTITADVVDGAG